LAINIYGPPLGKIPFVLTKTPNIKTKIFEKTYKNNLLLLGNKIIRTKVIIPKKNMHGKDISITTKVAI
jgi:hypothetical protein